MTKREIGRAALSLSLFLAAAGGTCPAGSQEATSGVCTLCPAGKIAPVSGGENGPSCNMAVAFSHYSDDALLLRPKLLCQLSTRVLCTLSWADDLHSLPDRDDYLVRECRITRKLPL